MANPGGRHTPFAVHVVQRLCQKALHPPQASPNHGVSGALLGRQAGGYPGAVQPHELRGHVPRHLVPHGRHERNRASHGARGGAHGGGISMQRRSRRHLGRRPTRDRSSLGERNRSARLSGGGHRRLPPRGTDVVGAPVASVRQVVLGKPNDVAELAALLRRTRHTRPRIAAPQPVFRHAVWAARGDHLRQHFVARRPAVLRERSVAHGRGGSPRRMREPLLLDSTGARLGRARRRARPVLRRNHGAVGAPPRPGLAAPRGLHPKLRPQGV